MMKNLTGRSGLLFAIWLAITLLCSARVYAQPTATIKSGNYKIHYSVFNSLLVPKDVARIHDLPRAHNRALINISVHDKQTNDSLSATVRGSVKNLMQQLRTLDFKEIKEQNYQYYLADVRHTNEETMHFDIEVKPANSDRWIPVNFPQKLYVEK